MSKVIYSMSVSLDGFVTDREGAIDWSAPDEELHRFHNDRVREIGVQLLGRRLYEVMTYWETAEEDASTPDYAREFARIWKPLPKIVFSTTLEEVVGNTRLATGDVADELARCREQTNADIAVGGAGLAAACIELGLVDAYQLFVVPVVLGGGTPFFPPLRSRIGLELVETRTFGSRVVYLHYRRAELPAS
jgi:dihydrofolate reductase